MADDKKEKWLNWLALSTLIFSAAATLGSSKAGGYSGKSTAHQILASDQWAFYQAKSTKQHLYELQREALTLQALAAPENAQAKYKETIDHYAQELTRYDGEKKAIKAKAEGHEKTRDESAKFAELFGQAVLYLQVAIILSAMAGLLKKQPMWFISFLPGVTGLVYFLYAYWLTW
ncbi:MAG: DUF4337 domain-containing protein [Verrucomicrobiota bacterium]